jgi:hypothetical protein
MESAGIAEMGIHGGHIPHLTLEDFVQCDKNKDGHV